ELGGRGPHEADGGVFGGGVGGDVGRADQAGDGGDGDDPAPVPLQHRADDGPGAEEGAGGVHPEHGLPIGQRDPGQRRRVGPSGVVDEDFDFEGAQGALDGGLVAHVEGGEVDAAVHAAVTHGGAEIGGRLGQGVLVAAGEEHVV